VSRAELARRAALGSLLALLLLMPVWHGWLAPPREAATLPVLAIAMFPLLLPLRGMLRGRASTHVWAGLVALLYLTHGVVELYSSEQRALALLEVLLALGLFAGASFYVRFSAQEHPRPSG
jgi:uncharacterized membrane protein